MPTHTIQNYTKNEKFCSPFLWELGNCPLVFIPANLYNNHWAMIVANLKTKEIKIMDSMNGRAKTAEKRREWMEFSLYDHFFYNFKNKLQENVEQIVPKSHGEFGELEKRGHIKYPPTKRGVRLWCVLPYFCSLCVGRAAIPFPIRTKTCAFLEAKNCF
jgi:hypothetical protein